MTRRRSPTALAIKVIALGAVTVVLTVLSLLAVTTLRIEPHHTYTAVFTDVSGMRVAADVRAAGVALGRVETMRVQSDNTVRVGFTVSDDFPMTSGTQITVRYKDLLGTRYLDLAMGPGRALADGASISADHTHPALDIDELTNGFAPLLQGLQPDQVNDVAGSITQITQGQAQVVEPLLGQVGSLTGALADRDAAIGSLVTNLNVALGTANGRAGELDELIRRLRGVISGYAGDRVRLGADLQRIDGLARSLVGTLPQLRPQLAGTIRETDRLTQLINSDAAGLNGELQRLPGYYQLLGRLGAYSSAFNGYLCGVALRLPDGTRTAPLLASHGKDQRCSY